MISDLSGDAIPDLPDAACRDIDDPDVFFTNVTHRVEQVRNLCRRCPAIRDCLAWALTHNEQGIWAATTPEQRAELLTRHGRKAS